MQFPYEKPLPHYYGDMTRIIFVTIGIVMLLGLPRMTELLAVPIGFAIAGIVVVAMAAGLTNPKQYVSLVINVLVSILGLATFIYISSFMRSQDMEGFYLVLNQMIAVLFLVAMYLSIKSLRGFSGN